jgi:hypothetical protein
MYVQLNDSQDHESRILLSEMKALYPGESYVMFQGNLSFPSLGWKKPARNHYIQEDRIPPRHYCENLRSSDANQL